MALRRAGGGGRTRYNWARMATVLFGTHMVRYPLGGSMSSKLQWVLGFKRLGHDVYVIEKGPWPHACYDPSAKQMTDDPSYGTRAVGALLSRFGLGDNWCYVDRAGRHHGMPKDRVARAFRSADAFFDYGTHGTWADEAATVPLRVLIDGEPGYRQICMERGQQDGGWGRPDDYHHYFTVGRNVGTPASTAPTAGRRWRPVFSPVDVESFPHRPPPAGAPFTTVMNWQAHKPVDYGGRRYGQKDVEFAKFLDLPKRTSVPLEVAVSGNAPREALVEAGWRVRRAQAVTATYDSFVDYVMNSAGEFSVCKNVFVATRSGWFSDRSAAYLASGRPVVMQETGFSQHLPCGRGLFAAETPGQAADALDAIQRDPGRHGAAAREIAVEYLDSRKVIARLMRDVGL